MMVTLDEGRKDRDKGIDDDDGGEGDGDDDEDLKEKLQFNEMLDEEKEGDRDDDDDRDDNDRDDNDDDRDDDDDSNDEKEDGHHSYSVISRRHSVLPLSIGSSVDKYILHIDKHILHIELVQPKYLQPPQLGHIITSMLDAWKEDKKRKDKKKKIEQKGEEGELMVMTMTGFRAALVEVDDLSD